MSMVRKVIEYGLCINSVCLLLVDMFLFVDFCEMISDRIIDWVIDVGVG